MNIFNPRYHADVASLRDHRRRLDRRPWSSSARWCSSATCSIRTPSGRPISSPTAWSPRPSSAPLRAADPRPRQRRRAAALSRAARALLAGARRRADVARVLPAHDGTHFNFWHEAWEKWVSDTMWRARLWIPYGSMPIGLGHSQPAICRRHHQAGDRSRAAVRHWAKALGRRAAASRPRNIGSRYEPDHQGGIVLIVTLVVLLSGAPVAFGLGAIAIVFLVLFQGFDSLRVAAETFYAGLTISRSCRSRCS